MRRPSKIIFITLFISLTLGVFSMAYSQGKRMEVAVSEGIRCVPGEFLVRFKAGTSLQTIAEINRSLGVRVKYTSPFSGTMLMEVPEGGTISEMVRHYRDLPSVKFAEPNGIVRAHSWEPNDPYYESNQWHLKIIDMPEAWEIQKGDTTVILAILDSGVAYEDYPVPSYESETVKDGVTDYKQAPDLAGTKFVPGYDFVNDDSHPNDNNAHGTHVAGTVAQTTNNGQGAAGVAFQCALMPVKVLNYYGSGDWLDLADGIRWAADHGADAINMSLGGSSYSEEVHDAVLHADSLGVVMIASAGNSGESGEGIDYPAKYDEVIAVGATDINDGRPSYSCYGAELELVAPGGTSDDPVWQETFTQECVVWCTPWSCYIIQKADPTEFSVRGGPFYGTSMAAPHVTGLVGLLIANGITDSDSIRKVLQETAIDLGDPGWDKYYGYGRIDADSALGRGGVNADFIGEPTKGCAPLTVNFTDKSTGDIDTWSWDFGDGGKSNEQNPTHEYTSAGSYTVSLTVSGPGGEDTETKPDYITVSDVPNADFVGSPTEGPAPLTVEFTDKSTGGPTSWSWDFGDGGTSEEQNPTHTYEDTGTYTVTLTATNDCGSDTETKVDYITVTEPLDAEFSATPTSGCAPLTVNFTDESTGEIDSWSWDFGDGGTSEEQNPTHEYTSAGSYTVSLTVSGPGGEDTETKPDYITVSDVPNADFVGSPTEGPAPLTVEFTDKSTGGPTSWSWDFGDGGTSEEQNPTHTYEDTGTYTVTLTATNDCGSDTETKVDYIRVTAAEKDRLHVHAIDVTRQTLWSWARGVATITIYDQDNNPVSDATVYGDFSGPTSESKNGNTDSNGQVTFYSSVKQNPSGEWCFEVTDVAKSDWTYDPDANEVTKACESGPVYKLTGLVPDHFYLGQNYPNPFNPKTEIRYSIPVEAEVSLEVFNAAGQRIATLVDEHQPAGIYTVSWNAQGMASGLYFYRITAGGFTQMRKMVLLK